MRSEKPTSKPPVESHVQAVVSCSRSSLDSPSRSTNATTAPANARKTESVEIQPAVRRVIDVAHDRDREGARERGEEADPGAGDHA